MQRSRDLDKTDVRIRMVGLSDQASIAAIDAASYQIPWGKKIIETHISHCLSTYSDTYFGLVAQERRRIIGFTLYERQPTGFEISRLAVAAQYRQQGIASHLVQRVLIHLQRFGLNNLFVLVDWHDQDRRVFFASQNFKTVALLPSQVDDTYPSEYLMCHQIHVEQKNTSCATGKNRIRLKRPPW